MNKNWTVFEKGVAILQIVIGFLLIIGFLYTNYYSFNVFLESEGLSWNDVSVLAMLKKYGMSVFFDLFTIFSGIQLLRSKKIGWITSLVYWFFLGLVFLLNIFNSEPSQVIFSIIKSLVYLSIGYLLLSKYFQAKYQPAKQNYWVAVLLGAVLFLNYFFKA